MEHATRAMRNCRSDPSAFLEDAGSTPIFRNASTRLRKASASGVSRIQSEIGACVELQIVAQQICDGAIGARLARRPGGIPIPAAPELG